jgi:hypothetical protein
MKVHGIPLALLCLVFPLPSCGKPATTSRPDSYQLKCAAGPRWAALAEGEELGYYERKNNEIYCGEIDCGVRPMKGVDIATFEVFCGSSYARDKNHVYYPVAVQCDHFRNGCCVCYCNPYVVEGADPASFE